jgi:hypothetical protein
LFGTGDTTRIDEKIISSKSFAELIAAPDAALALLKGFFRKQKCPNRIDSGTFCGVDETRTRGLLRDRKLRAVAPFNGKPHIKSVLPTSPFV